jgi:hypothetical protein
MDVDLRGDAGQSMTFSGRTETQCPHGQRGTSVCLYCRQDARDAARKRRNKLLTRFGLTTLGGGVVIALVVGVLVTLAPASRTSEPAEADTTPATTAVVTSSAGASADSARPSLLSPQIAPGRRELGNGVVADRVGDEVTVTFDTDSLRTRIDWKFEGIVRATLPMVFGDAARGALDRIESGSLLERRNLIRDLPRRGVQIPLDSGLGTIRLYPILRQGRDGPLVTAYRADVIK